MATLGVTRTLEVLQDVGNLVVVAIEVAKSGPLGIASHLVELVSNAVELVKDLPGALPELVDLDASEVGQLGTAAYGLFQRAVAALRS